MKSDGSKMIVKQIRQWLSGSPACSTLLTFIIYYIFFNYTSFIGMRNCKTKQV